MNWTTILDIVSSALLLGTSLLTLVAAIGVLRLPETLSRLYAITAPHVLGTLLAMLGLALRLREPAFYGLLLIAAVLHMATTAIVCHMIGRASYRARRDRKERLIVDELASPLDREVPQDPPQPDAS